MNDIISILGHVFASLDVKTVGDLNFKNFDDLIDSEVRNFDVKPMEVDSVKTLIHCVGEFALTSVLNAFLVIQSAALVENSEEVVHLNYCSCVVDEDRPVRVDAHDFMLGFKLLDNLKEVPREGKYLRMFLL